MLWTPRMWVYALSDREQKFSRMKHFLMLTIRFNVRVMLNRLCSVTDRLTTRPTRLAQYVCTMQVIPAPGLLLLLLMPVSAMLIFIQCSIHCTSMARFSVRGILLQMTPAFTKIMYMARWCFPAWAEIY